MPLKHCKHAPAIDPMHSHHLSGMALGRIAHAWHWHAYTLFTWVMLASCQLSRSMLTVAVMAAQIMHRDSSY
jgi:hypothetical protein